MDKYTWVDLGSSYLPSDMLAAYLWAQLERAAEIQGRRREIWEYYDERLGVWASAHNVQLPTVPDYCDQSYHMYYLVLPSFKVRTALIQHLKDRGILSVFHYLPLNLSDMGRRYGGEAGDCPVAETVADRLLRLPFFYALTPAELDEVVSGLVAFENWD